MSKLDYKTRGNSNPQGKERVFFTCHPEDFNLFFEPICEEIFKSQNCAIWYDAEPETVWDLEEMAAELSRMQLFVIPVTSRFLYQANRAREILFRFAMEHHIPVLPLMQESGLEADFNRICGDLQFLDKNAAVTDPTALPYEQKLERFLSSVLLGDELAEKVRKAFDAYIFLSYRKKDRKYAQELMRLIHRNDFCRDIAIWYDEFLVPGEDFNHAIQDAMEKSKLFTFVVTPNLLEQGNYVMTTEYPVAKETGKPILPVEMAPTDHAALRENYSQIPEPTDAHDAPALSGVLSEGLMTQVKKLAIAENDSDPEHLFFIGLAYLSGIDVEEDRARGLKLVTTAAEGNLPEAMEKLVNMYHSGDGVAIDYDKCIFWQKKRTDFCRKQYTDRKKKSGKPDILSGDKYFQALDELGAYMAEAGRTEEAKPVYAEMLELAEEYAGEFRAEIGLFKLNTALRKMGDVYLAEGDLSRTRAYYEDALEISEKQLQAAGKERFFNPSVDALKAMESTAQKFSAEAGNRGLAVSYIQVGDLYREKGNYSKARINFEKALAILDKIMPGIDTMANRKCLSVAYERLGDICRESGKLSDARNFCEKNLLLSRQIADETGGDSEKRNLFVAYIQVGELRQEEGNISSAEKFYQCGLEIAEELSQKKESVESIRDLSVAYDKLSCICKIKGDMSQAQVYSEKNLELTKKLTEKSKTSKNVFELAVSYLCDGEVFQNKGDNQKAEVLYKDALVLFEEIRERGDIGYASRCRDHLFAIYARLAKFREIAGNLAEAISFYEKTQELGKEIWEDQKTLTAYRDLKACYDKLGRFCEAEHGAAEARGWYQKILDLAEHAQGTVGYEEVFDTQCRGYEGLGYLYRADGMLDEARRCYEEIVDLCFTEGEGGRPLVIAYTGLAQVCESEHDIAGARDYYQQSLKITEELCREQETPEALFDLSAAYYNCGIVDRNNINVSLVKKAEDILVRLTEQFPQVPAYANQLQAVRNALQAAGGTIPGKSAYEQGYEYYEQGENCLQQGNREGADRLFRKAVPLFRQAAQNGDIMAQFCMGLCFELGHGAVKNYGQAARWYEKPAENGMLHAQLFLGDFYTNGWGGTRDYAQAARWYKMAAEQGQRDAQFNLGVYYLQGKGVPKNSELAARWFEKAAEQGKVEAQYNIGNFYREGTGVPKSNELAVKWYRKAAEQGFVSAQVNLGVHYLYGDGVPEDKETAAEWLLKAAKQGDALAKDNLLYCINQMPMFKKRQWKKKYDELR